MSSPSAVKKPTFVFVPPISMPMATLFFMLKRYHDFVGPAIMRERYFMAIRNYLEFNPQLDEGVYLAPSAEIIGRVHLMTNANVWFNSVIRGDVNLIKIGRNVNVQDLCMLHVTEQHALEIGDNTSLGHN